MGLDILLESETSSEVGRRPKVSHSLHLIKRKTEERVLYRCTNAEDGNVKGQNLILKHILNGDYKEFYLYDPSSPCPKSLFPRSVSLNVKDSGVVKRGSMYQSSRQIRRMQKLRDGRKNVEPYLNEDAFLSFELIDSSQWAISDSFRFPQLKKEPVLPLHVVPKSPYVTNTRSLVTSNLEFLELSFRDLVQDRSKISSLYSDECPAESSADSMLGLFLQTEESNSILGKEEPCFAEKTQEEERKSSRHPFLGTGIDANIIHERDIRILPKSFSAKMVVSNSYAESELTKSVSDVLKSSLKTHFGPFKKLLNPIMKSKSLCKPSLMEPNTSSDSASLNRLRLFPRSILNEFSKAIQKIDTERVPIGSDQLIKTSSSPSYLHANLKWEFNHMDPSTEFYVKDPEGVLNAKIWKTENPSNWVYTFHCCKIKSFNVTHGRKNRHLQPSLMIGQMLVSSHLSSEVSEAGLFDNSAITEFTLYDIAQARRIIETERSHCFSEPFQISVSTVPDSFVTECSSESNRSMETEKHRRHFRQCSSELDSGPSTSYPWASAELRPNLEIASIITQIPFSKKEASDNMQVRDNECCANQELSGRATGYSSPAYVKAVTPIGRHGLPDRNEVGPSSLLDRLRFGGGCDCGGWDMGCPIVVFDNAKNNNSASTSGVQQPIVLFVKGKKESIPVLTITDNGKSQYSVSFHAQLSALQAFSICIAILHSSEAFSAINGEKNKHKLYSHPLKLIREEDVRRIIDAVAEEEKRAAKKRGEQSEPSFFLDPPFSPIGRA